jgi:hypothetical protein
MSHDQAHEASATAAAACSSSQREQHNNLSAARSYSYDCPAPSSSLINPRALLSLVVLLVTWTSLLGAALAQETHGDRRQLAPLAVEDRIPTWKGPSLVLDTRPPPIAPFMHLQRRQNDEEATATTSAASSQSTIETDPGAAPTDFSVPQPFDTALSNNFTASCANFFQRLLTNEAFKQCRPFSLMLQVCLTVLPNCICF